VLSRQSAKPGCASRWQFGAEAPVSDFSFSLPRITTGERSGAPGNQRGHPREKARLNMDGRDGRLMSAAFERVAEQLPGREGITARIIIGWGARVRTSINRSRACCPTETRRLPSTKSTSRLFVLLSEHQCQLSQSELQRRPFARLAS
jgi:hypothetical protein